MREICFSLKTKSGQVGIHGDFGSMYRSKSLAWQRAPPVKIGAAGCHRGTPIQDRADAPNAFRWRWKSKTPKADREAATRSLSETTWETRLRECW